MESNEEKKHDSKHDTDQVSKDKKEMVHVKKEKKHESHEIDSTCMDADLEETHEEHRLAKKTDHKKGLNEETYNKIFWAVGIVLIILALVNIYQISSFNKMYADKLGEIKEEVRPAFVQLYTIKDNSCTNCVNIDSIVSSIKGSNVNITKESNLDLSSTEASDMIAKYGIKKIPAVILTGEINKTKITRLELVDDALVLSDIEPPYVDAQSKKVKGLVRATILKDSSCEKCVDMKQIITALKQTGIKVVSEQEIDKKNPEGKVMIDKYSIKVLPTLILSPDIEVYKEDIKQAWAEIGSVETDGNYVTRIENPPYVNVTTNKIEGLVSIVSLYDSSCADCYETDEYHKPVLQGIGVVFDKDRKVDVNSAEGEALVKKYDIEKVPTIILTGDVEKFPSLVKAWQSVGTKEDDGAYVFRNAEIFEKTYMDLTTGKAVTPTPTAQS